MLQDDECLVRREEINIDIPAQPFPRLTANKNKKKKDKEKLGVKG